MWPTPYTAVRDEVDRRAEAAHLRRFRADATRAQRMRAWNDWKMRWLWLAPRTSPAQPIVPTFVRLA